MGPLFGLETDSQAEQPAQKTPKLKLAPRMPLAASGNAEQGDVRTQHNLPGGMPLAAPEKIEAKAMAAYEQALHNTQQRQLKQALEEKESACRARDEALVETKRLRNDLDSALAKIGELETQVAGIQQRPPTQSRVGFVFGSAFQTRVYIGCHNPASSRWQVVIQHILKFTVQP